jgi:glycosyltransferase involved in cell wall biosynthesis
VESLEVRILHIVTVVDDAASYGGPLTVAVNQCRELIRRGHDARILAGWAGAGAAPVHLEGVPAHLFRVRNVLPGMRFSGLFSPSLAAWLRRNARTFDAAHVHLARDLVPLCAGVLLRRAGVPYVTQTHGMVVPDARPHAKAIDRALTLGVVRGAATRFVLTDAEEAALDELLGVPGTTVRLANGIEIPAQPGVPTEPLDVLFMARLHPRKRVMDFARAAEALIGEGHDATFSVVGPDDGDLPHLIRFLATHPHLDGRLRYEGPLPHDKALERLSRAGIYVLPSVDEPFPMTLLEALAFGVPSVCTSSCGVAATLVAENAAVVAPPGATHIQAAVRVLLDDPSRRIELSGRARTAASCAFSAEQVAEQLLVAYGRRPKVAA